MQTAFAIALIRRLLSTLSQGRAAALRAGGDEPTSAPEDVPVATAEQEATHSSPPMLRHPRGWVAYADDIHVVGAPSQLEHAMQLLQSFLPHGGHALQLAKVPAS